VGAHRVFQLLETPGGSGDARLYRKRGTKFDTNLKRNVGDRGRIGRKTFIRCVLLDFIYGEDEVKQGVRLAWIRQFIDEFRNSRQKTGKFRSHNCVSQVSILHSLKFKIRMG
jgi:hypothetical protein